MVNLFCFLIVELLFNRQQRMKEAGIMSKIKKINRVLGYKMKKEITTRSPEALERMCCGLVTAWEGTGQKV